VEIVKRTSRRVGTALAVGVVATAALAGGALAIDPAQTRESYVAQVEPICEKNTAANERILQGVRKKIKDGKLNLAAAQFTRAATAFEKAVTELRAVQQPSADIAKLTKWLRQLDAETELLRKIGKALREGEKTQAQAYSLKLTHNGNLANNLVLGFGFRHCLIKSSKFT
jgi:chaperonin cofactor prefoldin